MSDQAGGPPTDSASGGAIGAPGRHPVDEVQAAGGRFPTGDRKEPDEFIGALLADFESAQLGDSHGQEVVRVDRGEYLGLCTAAKAAGFENCADVTAVDWFRHRRTRFELVTNLLSHQHRRRLRILVGLPADEPTVASITGLWPGASFGEREVYDMFGIVFDGHPDLSRILMPDDWEGFPLRKDFGTGAVPVQFKGSHKVT